MNRGAEKRAASCDGKRIYTDILHARKVARAIHEQHNDRISPYRCKRCNGFHLGSAEHEKKPMKDR